MNAAIDHRHIVSPRAQRYVDAVLDGDNDALLAFAEHLIEEGLLGAGVEELRLGLTVNHLVERYVRTTDGTAELKAWAMSLEAEIAAERAA